MKLKNAFAAIAATTLVSAPVVAQAATADQARTGASVDGEELGGGIILPLVALAVVILGIILLTDGDEVPESP